MQKEIVNRCAWVNLKNPLSIVYHDTEWGVPQHTDEKLFEMLLLECFQAGLSWECILNKRENFRQAFDGFDVKKICRYDGEKCTELLSDPDIVRNRQKIQACIVNSRIFMPVSYTHLDVYKRQCLTVRTDFTKDYPVLAEIPEEYLVQETPVEQV